MSKFNGLAICACGVFSGENDKNGKAPVILTPLAGKIPSKRVLSGTIADNSGFIPGASYVIAFTEGEEDDQFGRQFSFTNGGRCTPVELLQFHTALGAGEIVEVMELKPAATGAKPAANEQKANQAGVKP